MTAGLSERLARLDRPIRQLQPARDLLERFEPRGGRVVQGAPIVLQIASPDAQSLEQSVARGPLGRALDKVARTQRLRF
jgi:hypothetical protein